MASIFTRILRGELPAERVFETESELAFLDINPLSEGHTLVIPKREVADFTDLPAEEIRALAVSLQTVTRAVTQAMGTPHYNLALNNGSPAGQVVFHLHFHIIPRYVDTTRARVRGKYPEGRMGEVGESIRQAMRELTGKDP